MLLTGQQQFEWEKIYEGISTFGFTPENRDLQKKLFKFAACTFSCFNLVHISSL